MQATVTKHTDDELVIYSSATANTLVNAMFIAGGGVFCLFGFLFVTHPPGKGVAPANAVAGLVFVTLLFIGGGLLLVILGVRSLRGTHDTTFHFFGRQGLLMVRSKGRERTIGFADLVRAEVDETEGTDTCYGVQLVLRESSETISLTPIYTDGIASKEALAGEINDFLDRWCPLSRPRSSDPSVFAEIKDFVGQLRPPSGDSSSDLGQVADILDKLRSSSGFPSSDLGRINDTIDKLRSGLPSDSLAPAEGFSGKLRRSIDERFAKWIFQKSMPAITCPLKVGDRVRTSQRRGGVVVEVDAKGNYGIGSIKVRFPDGTVLNAPSIGNDFQKEA